MSITLLARNPDLTIGGPVVGWSELSVTLRFKRVGSWSLTIPVERCPEGWPVPGAGLVIIRDGQLLVAGQWDEYASDWEAGGEYGEAGTYRLAGDTDLARIGYRLVYPDPAAAWTAQTTTARYEASGPGDVLLADLVDLNAGPRALPERRVPGLTVPTPAGTGAATDVSRRFTPLLDALRPLAWHAGTLGFDVGYTLDTGGLVFTVYSPTDRSTTARFSRGLGNLQSVTVTQQAPTGTAVLLAGAGEGTARDTREYANADGVATWGRREVFRDARSAEPTDYDKLGAETLDDNVGQVTVEAVAVDTPRLKYGRDYQLGDRVALETVPGVVVNQIVRQVDLDISADEGEKVVTHIGTADPTAADRWTAVVRDMQQRLTHLERGP